LARAEWLFACGGKAGYDRLLVRISTIRILAADLGFGVGLTLLEPQLATPHPLVTVTANPVDLTAPARSDDVADLMTELSRIKTASSVSLLVLLLAWENKVHHSRWQPETDSNYSSLFSFWDRLFGTFRWRDDPRTLRFGLEEFDQPEHHTLTGLLATPLRQVQRATGEAPGTATSSL
jgi:hypothetical protein